MSKLAAAVPSIPYRGIHPFRYLDHAIFFARGEETRRLASLVSVYRGVLLYGDSGSGKSSLVNAGLIPAAIRLGFAPERLRVQPRTSGQLVVERIRSGGDDDEAELLPSVLALDDEPSARTVLTIDAFEERINAACERHRPLLIFDQFEEIITLFDEAGAADARGRLAELFGRLLRGSLPVKILFSFREDYLGKVKELLSACPELVDQALRIAPPSSDALPAIIRGPFERYPDHFPRQLSPALTNRLVTVLAERFGAGEISLSEVQTVCLRLWQSDNPEVLLGKKGAQGLLEDYLGDALDAMPAELRPAAIVLLAQMVTSAGTRNVISAGDLFHRVREQEGDIAPSLLDQALEGLSRSRLVRRERRRDLDLYEVSSEFLLPWIGHRRDEFRQLQNRRRERRRLIILGSIAAALLLIAVAVGALAAFAFTSRDEARSEARAVTAFALASAAQANAGKGPDVGLLLSLAALAPYRAGPAAPVAVRSNMIEALESTELEGMIGVLHGDTGPVDSVAFSPDGRMLASGSVDGSARLWDVATHKQLGSRLAANTLPVSSVAFNANGRFLATGGDYGTVQLWDVATHRLLSSLGVRYDSSVAFSPAGRILAVGSSDGAVQLIDVATRKEVAILVPSLSSSLGAIKIPSAPLLASKLGPVNSIAFSPNGRQLVAGSGGGTVELWDLSSDTILGSLLTTKAGPVNSVAFSPDGKLLAAGSGDGMVRLWDTATGRQLGSPLTTKAGPVNSVAFSPDGKLLAAGSGDGMVWLWDTATGRQLGSPLTTGAGPVDSIGFSPSGDILASGSGDGAVELWDVAIAAQLGSPLTANTISGFYRSIAFSPDRDTLAVGDLAGKVRLWDVADPAHPQPLGRPLTGAAKPVTSIAFSPNGRILASGNADRTVRLWDVADPAHPQPLGRPLTGAAKPVTSIAFSPNGRILASGNADRTVRLWDVADPAHPQPLGRPLTGAAKPVTSIAFSPNGRTLASASDDGTIRLWDLADPAKPQFGPLLTAHTGPVTSVAFSPSGRTLASAGDDGTIRLWDLADPEQPSLPLTGDTGPVTSVAFSPDGRTLASASDDGTIRLWDVATHTQLGLPLTGDTGPVTSVAFSPDGRTLASTSSAGRVRLWSGFLWPDFAGLRNQVCRLTGTGLSPAEWALYVPDMAYQESCP